MKSYQVIEWGKPLEAREYQTPVPNGSEVLVRITSSGMCHSDLHIISGGFDLGDGNRARLEDRGVHTPYTPGHEILGEVVALGADAKGVNVGDKRIVFPWIGCGTCKPCGTGDENLCANPRFIGARVDGGYSDHVMVPDAKYLVDYGEVNEELACTYACSGITAYTALKRVGPLDKDDHLMLIGAGGVGYNGFHLAPHVWPAKRLVADIGEDKRTAALRDGADACFDPRAEDAVGQVMKTTGEGAAGVIDFVGSPESFQFGMDVLKRGGSLVIVGLFGGAQSVPVPMFPFKVMTVRGSYVGTLSDMHDMMDIIKAGNVPPIPIETRPMADVNAALADLEAGKIVGRVVFKP